MPRFKIPDYGLKMIPVDFERQILPGTSSSPCAIWSIRSWTWPACAHAFAMTLAAPRPSIRRCS
jgi:hypothetical protein